MHPFLDHDGPIAFAHRGGALEFPENTMAAFQGAVRLGYHYLETDAYASRDGTVFAFHDDRLDRVTDGTGRIADLSASDVRRARVAGTEPIPLLADVLTAWPDVRVNIDPKHDGAVRPLIALLNDLNCLDRVCVGSFSGKRLSLLRSAFADRLCTALGPLEVMRLWGLARGLPSGRFHGRCAQIPVRERLAGRNLELVEERLLAAAHRLGIKVHVWTIDEEAEMDRLLDLGVDGLMTDRPSALRTVLERRGQWA